MNKTRIDWCKMTWNPVTGCLHGCPYCYAKKIARRFSDNYNLVRNTELHELDHPVYDGCWNSRIIPYPFEFEPTFHKYRLNEPAQIKKPQNIFVCSMADLFGDWVPDEWIEKVFEACSKAPQHRYLFLTKNPKRYLKLMFLGSLDNYWLGTTITNNKMPDFVDDRVNCFLSIEPIQEAIDKNRFTSDIGWVIIGAETGNRKDKIIPKKEWIENIVNYCREKNVPVFMKSSLKEIWQEPLIQEFPWRDE